MRAPIQPESDIHPADAVTLPGTIATPGLDLRQRLEMSEVADVARCPVCRAPVVFRMSCAGPVIHCLCAGSAAR
jgi:hypothetical protein